MDAFNTFPPSPVVVTLSGGALELTPIRLGELPRLLAVMRPLASELSADPDWLALLGQHGDSMLDLLAITTRRERAWINDLPLDDAVQLAAAVFEVNADFFVGRVVPGIQRSADKLAPLIRSLGTAPSPA
ncbi:hypothetical protein H7691_11825 [Stenotrophomonas sp. CW117]|jgi:hypothetical protein|uniref:hypothetical protein n=1 Tax=Stenotrophomonas TaxID=40323 RepID=UPI000702AFE7|nr:MULTISPECIES: hypothetical protein [Stenotrophomonas]KRG85657.1 hypothetical protein ABB33_07170 [Stenotrophomonas acidaminiphila]QOF97329.1 hypothetical protein H7691_11825 [Stenotrophomonas sp. CW117]